MPNQRLKVVKPTDNVATVLRDVDAGEVVDVAVGDETRTVEVTTDIAFGHKLAIERIATGETVRKYGTSIGNATEDIAPGSWVHVHNVESNYGRGDMAGSNKTAVHE
jgi:altronate dehydratase small subunit